MKIGVSTASLYPLETELALSEIGKSGVKTTEIFFNCESELKPSFVDMLLDIKSDYGLDITAIHPTLSLAESFMIFSEYERRFYETIQKYVDKIFTWFDNARCCFIRVLSCCFLF